MPIKLYPPPGISFDANNNIVVNNTLEGFTTTATAAATTTLTVASTPIQEFTGSTTQIVKLPVASTLTVGQAFYIINNSSGVVTVNSSGNNLVQTLAANTATIIKNVLITGTTAASWDSALVGAASGITTGTTTSNGTEAKYLKTVSGVVQSGVGGDDGTSVTVPNGTYPTTGGIKFANGTILYSNANGAVALDRSSGDVAFYFNPPGQIIQIGVAAQFTWASTNNALAAVADTGLARVAAKVAKITDGSTGLGWLQTAGTTRVATDVTNATASMAAITGLTATLIAGRFYTGRMILFAQDATAVDGFKCDFDGGTATMTGFRAHGTIYDTALLLSTPTSAIATDFVAPTMTGVAKVEIDFGFTCNAAGTFIPRFAKNSVTALDATVFRESWMSIIDTA